MKKEYRRILERILEKFTKFVLDSKITKKTAVGLIKKYYLGLRYPVETSRVGCENLVSGKRKPKLRNYDFKESDDEKTNFGSDTKKPDDESDYEPTDEEEDDQINQTDDENNEDILECVISSSSISSSSSSISSSSSEKEKFSEMSLLRIVKKIKKYPKNRKSNFGKFEKKK